MEYTNNEKFSKPDKNDLYSLALWNENTEKTDAALAIAGKPDEYSASKTYAVGDKCIYENALYKCITAISTAEAWTAGHWAKTSLCAEDTANKAAIKELTEKSKKAIIIKQVTSKTNFEVGANSALRYETDATLFPTIEGYTRIGFIGARTNNEVGIIIYDNGWMSNPQNMNKTFTITLTWVFVKNELLT